MKEELKLMTVARYSDQMSAEIAAGMLNANGIPAEVFGQTSSYPSINAATSDEAASCEFLDKLAVMVEQCVLRSPIAYLPLLAQGEAKCKFVHPF